MKAVFTSLLLAIATIGFCQSKFSPDQKKQIAMQMMQNQGTLIYQVNDKKESAKAVFIRGVGNYYSILSSGQSMSGNRLMLHFKELKSGVQEFNKQEPNASGFITGTKAYEIRGNISLKVSGNDVSGTFEGQLIDIAKRESQKRKADRIDANAIAGQISGSFSGLKLVKTPNK